MKPIFTLMVTIFMYSLSFGQNSNDCNIIPNKAEFQDFIKFDENKNVKSLNSFIEMKNKEKDELKLLQDQTNNSNGSADYYGSYYEQQNQTDYDRFKIYRNHIININLLNNETEISTEEYNAIKGIKSLIYNNIDIYNTEKLADKDSADINSRNNDLKTKLEALVFEEIKNDKEADTTTNKINNIHTYGINEKPYKINTTSLEQFIKTLHLINASDFNKCAVIIKTNLNNVHKDINNAENYLSDLSSRELTEFRFKKHIMVIVGALIAIILVCFFTGVLYKATDAVKQKLIGETGLQFITIFVIIIAVILFGVMNILKGSELAAILSAIAGYILGKTAPPKSDKTLEIELEILRLKSQEAGRLKQEEADKKVVEAIIKEEEKSKLEIEAEKNHDDIKPKTTANDSVKEDDEQELEALTANGSENLANIGEDPTDITDESHEFHKSDESNEGVDLDQKRDK